MSDVLNGISHFLGICVGIIIILVIIGYVLQTIKITPTPPPPKKNSHYHLVYNDKENNNDNSQSIETYQSSDPFLNNGSNY